MATKSIQGSRRIFLNALKEARIGVREAQYEVGLMYAHGRGVEQDFEQALEWVNKAADRGLAAAQYLVASRLIGEGGAAPQDMKPVWWYLRAAEQGHIRALFKLGKLWSSSQPQLALDCMGSAAEQGLAEAQYFCGKSLAERKDPAPDFANALLYFRKAAEQNFAPAVYAIGNMYARGDGMPVDVATAKTWYRRAVTLGWPAAQLALARLDAVGTGRANQFKKARKPSNAERRLEAVRWRAIEEKGDAEARFYLAQMFHSGIGVQADPVRAQTLYQLSARQGEARAQLALGLIAKEQNDPKALEWIEKAARNGNAEAQSLLAGYCEEGAGSEPGLMRSLAWYVRACEQSNASGFQGLYKLLEENVDVLKLDALSQAATHGNAQAQYLIGQRHAKGQGYPLNIAEAVVWWEAASVQGYAPAQCALGLQLLSGASLVRNVDKAVAYLQLAAEQDYPAAQWNLGALYASGAPGLAKDLIKAFEWCHKAATSEFVPAQATLGLLYARMGDTAKALHWWRLAAEGGDAEAQFNLALQLLNPKGGTSDPEQAFHWFHAAASQGLAPAQTQVGILYATGQGVAEDRIEAHKWFAIAARASDQAARQNLARSAAQISPEQRREALRRAETFVVIPGR